MRLLIDGHILEAVQQLVNLDGELLAAVAFWGRGAGQQTGITGRAQPSKILCDLLSGSCNPAEIRRLQEYGVHVKYRPNLHAKVWLNGNEVVVGSANASMNGLGFETAGPNIEAAVHLRDKEIAGKVRKWFLREWGLAECIDDALLQTAEALWKKKQNATGAIMRCRITAYEECELSPEARECFDQIAHNHYTKDELAEIQANAVAQGDHPADATCYELLPDDVPPTPGTVYMDYSHDGSSGDFDCGGFWEIIHNEHIDANNHTLCLLRKRSGREFPTPRSCGGRVGVGAMVSCHLDNAREACLDMEFRKFFFLQQHLHCQKIEQRCANCPCNLG